MHCLLCNAVVEPHPFASLLRDNYVCNWMPNDLIKLSVFYSMFHVSGSWTDIVYYWELKRFPSIIYWPYKVILFKKNTDKKMACLLSDANSLRKSVRICCHCAVLGTNAALFNRKYIQQCIWQCLSQNNCHSPCALIGQETYVDMLCAINPLIIPNISVGGR